MKGLPEASNLGALREAGAVRVPDVLAVRDAVDDEETGSGRPRWLALEWLEPGRATAEAWRRLGEDLAALHRHRGERWGWHTDNFIGPLPQLNGRHDSWPEFWWSRRLEPQLRRAYDGGFFDQAERRRFERLSARLEEVLAGADEEGPSLLHGDFWNGNVHMVDDGTAAIVDPATYHGHREVDLAMAELFGGFGPDFQRAYHGAWPVDRAFRTTRVHVYQLYYLLVHVNLFGRGYVGGALGVLTSAGF